LPRNIKRGALRVKVWEEGEKTKGKKETSNGSVPYGLTEASNSRGGGGKKKKEASCSHQILVPPITGAKRGRHRRRAREGSACATRRKKREGEKKKIRVRRAKSGPQTRKRIKSDRGIQSPAPEGTAGTGNSGLKETRAKREEGKNDD